MNQNYPHYYSKTQNIAHKITDDINRLFQSYDLLVLPTIPFRPNKLPAKDLSSVPPAEVLSMAFDQIVNTALFNITGHPALSIPCGLVDGLPVGLMIVGKHFHEGTIYTAASAFEKYVDWKTL